MTTPEPGTLPDYLKPGLDLVIVGFNPGITSGTLGHYYAYPQNTFWRLLHESGLVPVRLGPEDDHRLPSFGIGLTDVVKRMSPGSQDLSTKELREGARALLTKLEGVHPKVVAFTGKGVFRAVRGSGPVPYGPRPEMLIPGVRAFVAPSPSGRSGLPYAKKLTWMRQLAAFVAAVCQGEVP